MTIKDRIHAELNAIEEKENLTILLAVESGSRAWGFASPDSDYDVRFIYIRPQEFYLKLEKRKDVCEWALDETLDINGWDFDKTLRLLRSSNPTLFEWMSSPIVYRKHPAFDSLMVNVHEYFMSIPGLHHYLHMAEGNYREFLKGDIVKLKKYFYVIRPILETAMDNGIEALVLGAFGCGAFRNPPQLVSQAFHSVLEEDGYKEHFAKIVFAIIGTSNRSNENLNVFRRTFS